MAAMRGCEEMAAQSSFSDLSLGTCFEKMLEKVAHMLSPDNLKVIKIKLKIKHSYSGAECIDSSVEVLKRLVKDRFITDQDLDLLEDLLDMSGELDVLGVVSNFKTKRSIQIDYLPLGSATAYCSGMPLEVYTTMKICMIKKARFVSHKIVVTNRFELKNCLFFVLIYDRLTSRVIKLLSCWLIRLRFLNMAFSRPPASAPVFLL